MTCCKARQLISQISEEQKQALTHISNCDDCEPFFLDWITRIFLDNWEIPEGRETCLSGTFNGGRELDAETMNRMQKRIKESVLRNIDNT